MTLSHVNQMPLSHGHVSHDLPGTGMPSAALVLVNTPLDITPADVGWGGFNRVGQTNARGLTAPLTAKQLQGHVVRECYKVKTFLNKWKKVQENKTDLGTWYLQKSRYTIHATSSNKEAAIQRLGVVATKVTMSLPVERPEAMGCILGLGLSEQNFLQIKELIFEKQSCPFRTGSLKDVYEQYGFVMTEHKGHNKMWAGWKTYIWLKILVDFESLLDGVQCANITAIATLLIFQGETDISETAPEASTGAQQRCKEKCLFCDQVCTNFLVVEADTFPRVTDEGVFCDRLTGEMCEVTNRTATVQATVKDIQRFDFQNGVFICKGCFPKTGSNQPPEIVELKHTVYDTSFFWRNIFTINATNKNGVELYISNDTSVLRNKVSKVREIDHLEARHSETHKRLRGDYEYSELCKKSLRAPLTEAEGNILLGHFSERDLVELVTWYYSSCS